MEFIDSTGHIFYLEDYSSYPIGFEYEENNYVFWLENDYNSKLSVDCFYIKPIRVLFRGKKTDISKINISIHNSNHYKLLSSNKIQELIESNKNIFSSNSSVELFDTECFSNEIEYIINANLEDQNKGIVENLEEKIYTKNGYIYYGDVKDDKKDTDGKTIYYTILYSYDLHYAYINNNKKIYCNDYEVLFETVKTYNVKINDDLRSLHYNIYNKTYDITILKTDIRTDENKNKYILLNDKTKYIEDDTILKLIIDEQDVIINEENKPFIIIEGVKKYCVKDKSTIYCNENEILLKNDGTPYIKVGNNEIICTKHEYELKEEIINYMLIPFYVVGNVKEPGTWLTNILINFDDSVYCPITVGGTYYDEQEELIINGKNIGLNLPKDIIRSLYNSSFYNDTIDYAKWNNKIKEYLANHMQLKSDKGNYKNVLTSLKWFGYGDKISVSKLIKTDNEFIAQYINDKFTFDNDIIKSYKFFKNTTYINLSLNGVIALDEENKLNFDNEFWGEGKPKLQDLFNTQVAEKIPDTDIEYIRQYYDFGFNELGLKLCCLKYYFEKYFLPIHIKIFRSSIVNQCFASDIKMLNTVMTHIQSNSVHTVDNNIIVNFPKLNNLWLSEQIHFIDDNFNEFSDYIKMAKESRNIDLYYLNDICVSVPIEFSSLAGEQYYDVYALLYRNNEIVYEKHFNFINNTYFTYNNGERISTNVKVIPEYDIIENRVKYYTIDDNGFKIELNRNVIGNDYSAMILYPKLFGLDNNMYDWLNSTYKLTLLVNGRWFTYEFIINMPELDIHIGKLKYVYNYDMYKQFNGITNNIVQFNAKMHCPDLVTVNNSDFANMLSKYMKNNCLLYSNDNMSILKDNIYYYYISKYGAKCIYTIDTINKDNILTYNYNILSNDINFDNYIDENISHEIIDHYKYFSISENDSNFELQILELKDAINNSKIYSSISKDINSFIDIYKETINLPNNVKNILNRIHLFNLIELNENGSKEYKRYNPTDSKSTFNIKYEYNNIIKTVEFGDNDSENITNLYLKLFNENGDWNNDIYYLDKNTWIKDNYLQLEYDLYLMHDDLYWYCIMISKSPISNFNDLYKPYPLYKINNENSLYLEYVRSDNKFLVNRVKFEDANGIHQFNNNDIIACKIENINIPFKLTYGSKWEIKPISLGISNFANIKSNTNIGIISIGNNIKYEKGYYEIKVHYTIDNNDKLTYNKTTKFLIK